MSSVAVLPISTSSLVSPRLPTRTLSESAVEDREVELAEAFAVGQDVHLDDPAASHGQAADRERLAVPRRDSPDDAVHQRGLHDQADLREGRRTARNLCGAADLLEAPGAGPEVDAQHDLGVEHPEQRL